MSKKNHIIRWKHPVFVAKDRYLFLNENNETLFLPLADKATRFDREECNLILIALAATPHWSLLGKGSFPSVEVVG